MSVLSGLKNIHQMYFSKPESDRLLYRAIRRQRVTTILELGIGNLDRTLRLIAMAGRLQGDMAQIAYTGIDLFDARSPDFEPLRLKHAHQSLSRSGAKIKLVPGDVDNGLTRMANALLGTDLVIMHTPQVLQPCSKAWFYFPRILHRATEIFQEELSVGEDQPGGYRTLAHEEIHHLAQSVSGRRVA